MVVKGLYIDSINHKNKAEKTHGILILSMIFHHIKVNINIHAINKNKFIPINKFNL